MRILHVGSGNLYGGIETLLVTLARYGHQAGLEQEFALSFRRRLFDELTAQNVPIHFLGEVHFSRPFSLLKARKRLATLLEEHSFEAVLFHGPWAYAAFASIAKAKKIPAAFWAHG